MPLIGFRPEFEVHIRAGFKTQTVRIDRKRPVYPGDRLYMYVGLRRPGARKIGEAVCWKTTWVWIGEGELHYGPLHQSRGVMRRFARREGFESWMEFVEYLRRLHGLPFEGVAIQWREGRWT